MPGFSSTKFAAWLQKIVSAWCEKSGFYAEFDPDAVLEQIRANLADQCPLRRWGAVQLNKFALSAGPGSG